MKLMPESLQGYQTAWLTRDIIAGLTLSAVAIPEVMGYTSIDYSAGVTLANLVKYCQAHNARFVLVRPDAQLLATLGTYQTLEAIGEDNIFPTLAETFRAYRADAAASAPQKSLERKTDS